MKRMAATLAMLLGACGVDHSTDRADAAALDAPVLVEPDVGHDAAAPDASCPDLDGDGAADAVCGGDDCDDADPAVGPAMSTCVGPVTVRHCVGGMRVDEACAAATPDCDARIGACAVSACGDLVVQPDESCDGGTDCISTCQRTCWSRFDCAEVLDGGRCAGIRGPHDLFNGICVHANPGGALLGERCTLDAECESNWCDPVQARCSELGMYEDECPALPQSWPAYETATWSSNRIRFVSACEFPCQRPSDCPSSSRCVPLVLNVAATSSATIVTACVPAEVYSAPLGAPCRDGCESNMCVGGWAAGYCSQLCVDDADCPSVLPHCSDIDYGSAVSPPPASWMMPFPKACTP